MGRHYGIIALILVLCLVPGLALAFPDNGVLDAFTGTNGTTPPDGSFTNAEIAGSSGCVIQSNGVAPGGGSGRWGCYWNVTTFNADQESYITYNNLNAFEVFTCARLANIGSGTTDGYCVSGEDAAALIKIWRIDNEAVTQIGSSVSQAFTNGDRIGITVIGNQICSYFSDNGAAWVQKDCQTDSTYSAGGRIGLMVNGSTTQPLGDDFGGGNVGGGGGGGSSFKQFHRRLQ